MEGIKKYVCARIHNSAITHERTQFAHLYSAQ